MKATKALQNQAVQQIAPILNDVVTMGLGKSELKVVDTSTFVSLGDLVNTSDITKDAFFGTLWDVIGRTTIAIRRFEPKRRAIKRDEMEFGSMYRKISFRMLQATDNPTWDIANGQASPYDVEKSTEIIQKVFTNIGTWSNEDLIPTVQLNTAFDSPLDMMAVISGIYTSHQNALTIQDDMLANMACATYMAKVINSGNAVCVRHLLTEYNTLKGTTMTAAQAHEDLGYLKYATRQINKTFDNIQSATSVFNIEGLERQTPADKIVAEINSDFLSSAEMYLQADTFHNNFVALKYSEVVPYWQGTQNFDFESTSTINIQLDADTTVNQSGIIAFVHDYDAVGSSIYGYRTYTKFNERSEVEITMDKAERAFIADTSENGIVFISD